MMQQEQLRSKNNPSRNITAAAAAAGTLDSERDPDSWPQQGQLEKIYFRIVKPQCYNLATSPQR
jgi:hypothetical protein